MCSTASNLDIIAYLIDLKLNVLRRVTKISTVKGITTLDLTHRKGRLKRSKRCQLLKTAAKTCLDLVVKANSKFKYSTTRVSTDNVTRESNWTLAFASDESGQPVSGDLNGLFNATEDGFPIAVRITNPTTGRTYLSTCYQLDVTETNLCAHIPFGITMDSWDGLTNSSVWVFRQVCTDGQMTQYSNTSPTPVYTYVNTSWYYRKFPCVNDTTSMTDDVFINLHKGEVMQGSLQGLQTQLNNGYRIVVLRHDINYGQGKKTVEVPGNYNVYITQTVVLGADITDHVIGLHIWSFLSRTSGPYLACRLISTDGDDKYIGWDLNSHSHAETQKTSKSKHSWLFNPCWKKIYSSPGVNYSETGSLNDLRLAVRNGHSIRLKITDDGATLLAEASHVVITPNGVVVAQILGNMKTEGFTFDPEGAWSWYFVHSDGYQCRYDVSISLHTEIRSTCKTLSAVWFMDNGEYDVVLETDDTGRTITGSRSDLSHGVMSGGEWKVKIELENDNGLERYLAVERIEQQSKTEVSSLSMRTAVSAFDSQGRMRLDSSCLGIALLVCSDSRVFTRRWKAGILDGEMSSFMANVTWFVSK